MRGAERALTVETLPGAPPVEWPVSIVESNGLQLLPFADAAGLHARLVGDDGARDVDLGPGDFVGAAALDDGFAVVTVAAAGLVLHRIAPTGPVPRRLGPATLALRSIDDALPALPGRVVPSIVTDGARVLVTSTGGGAVHALVVAGDAQPPLRIDLGDGSPSPQLFGDVLGFVVDRLTVGADGTVARAPSEAIPGARLFRRADPLGDAITSDGARWLALDERVVAATRDAAGVELLVPDDGDGQRLRHVVADLTSTGASVQVPRSPSAPGFVRAVRDDVALWEAVVGSDHIFASLDRTSLDSDGTFVRVAAPRSRAVAVSLGARAIVLAWIGQDGCYAYARLRR